MRGARDFTAAQARKDRPIGATPGRRPVQTTGVRIIIPTREEVTRVSADFVRMRTKAGSPLDVACARPLLSPRKAPGPGRSVRPPGSRPHSPRRRQMTTDYSAMRPAGLPASQRPRQAGGDLVRAAGALLGRREWQHATMLGHRRCRRGGGRRPDPRSGAEAQDPGQLRCLSPPFRVGRVPPSSSG